MHFHTTNLHLTATKMFQHNSVVISDHLVVFSKINLTTGLFPPGLNCINEMFLSFDLNSTLEAAAVAMAAAAAATNCVAPSSTIPTPLQQ